MAGNETTFPDKYAAIAVSPDRSLEAVLKAMTYDVAAVVDNGNVIGTVTGSRVAGLLKRGEVEPFSPVEIAMEPWQSVGEGSDDLDTELRNVFCVFVFSVIRRQVDAKVFNPSKRDGILTVLFTHVRKQLNNNKYESCTRKMAFAHWLRTVINNKIIDELRKIPAPETVEEFRDKQRARGHMSNANPVKDLNRIDVMEIIHQAISQLPEKQRVAVMHNIQHPDMPGDDAAEALGMTLNAFHLNLNRARDKIQNILKELAPETVSVVRTLRNRPRSMT